MNTQAEAELKQLVERELQAYDKFDQGSEELVTAIVHGVLRFAEVGIGCSAMGFKPKIITTLLCQGLQRSEIVKPVGMVLGKSLSFQARRALSDAIKSMTEWLVKTGETDPGKIGYTFRGYLKKWNFFHGEDMEAFYWWGQDFEPDLEFRHYKPGQ